MLEHIKESVLAHTLAAAASLGMLALTIAGAARLEAQPLVATPTCASLGAGTEPATALLASDPNGPACVFDGARGLPLPVVLPPSQPAMLFGGLPVPRPAYHHVGTWNSDLALERATVHSSQLISVETKPGDCFWRTSHLVSWGAQGGRWVESGFFRCGDGPYVIFVFIWWGEGSPGYVIGPEVTKGATVTTFAEWECTNNTTLLSGGYFNKGGNKVYLIKYNTGASPCVELNQTDNNGEAYAVRTGRSDNFLVFQYTALNTRICDKTNGGSWLCRPWDKTFDTFTVEQVETYDVHWFPSPDWEVKSTYYSDWFGRGHPPGRRAE